MSIGHTSGVFQDLRFAQRRLRADWGFTCAAVVTLALAIALNAAVFTVMDAMLHRGFPLVKRNDRLVYLQERPPAGTCCISYADFEDWRSQSTSFDGLAFVASNVRVTLRDGARGDGAAAELMTFKISANTFGLLGVPPALGRDFVPGDEAPGAPPVAILNHRLWESRYQKRADVVGSEVQINGALATIIGVMPDGFDFPTRQQLWMPVVRTPELLRRGLTPEGFTAVGRLREGVTPQTAAAELEAINRRLEDSYPTTNRGLKPSVATYAEITAGPDSRIIWGSLWGSAWFVFLIACANLSNLALVRNLGRWREFSIQLSLGANVRQVARQIVVENAILAAVAGPFALVLTAWSLRSWALATESQYQIVDYSVTVGTIAYVVGMMLLSAVCCSVAPVTRLMQLASRGALSADGRWFTSDMRGKRLASALVAGQMALAIVLLAGAGVLVRSFVNIVSADVGVRQPEHMLVAGLRLPPAQYPTPASRVTYFERLGGELKTIAGVDAQSASTAVPAGWPGFPLKFEIDGGSPARDEERLVQVVTIAPEYFRAMGGSAIGGREFEDGDRLGAAPVAIVNQRFVERFWPTEQPVGKRLLVTRGGEPGLWRTVVGVAPNVMQTRPGDTTRQQFVPLVYLPLRQEPAARAFVLVRTGPMADAIAPAVRALIQQLDPNVVVTDLSSLKSRLAFDRDAMDATHSELGKHATMAPAFALLALFVASIGLGAVISHSVRQRTREIGIRIAIGAAARDVRSLILREGMRPVAVGVGAGVAGAIGVNRLLQSQLVGVSPYDPVTMAAAPLLLIVVALAAVQVPVSRALGVDPAIALRHE